MLNNACYSDQKDVVEVEVMKLKELYPDVITEDTEYEYKATINSDKPINWAKTLVGYANNHGGTLFIGVTNDGGAVGLEVDEIDRNKNLIAQINHRHIFPHVKLQYMMRSVCTLFVQQAKISENSLFMRFFEYQNCHFSLQVLLSADSLWP